jgi:hypothetical protein
VPLACVGGGGGGGKQFICFTCLHHHHVTNHYLLAYAFQYRYMFTGTPWGLPYATQCLIV